jgi:hypothetical protein
MAGILSPDVRNLAVGKGIALFKPDGANDFFALGNCPKVVYSPKVTVLPHFSAMAGTKVQDFSIITQKGGDLAVDMEEMTANNLSLFFLGSVDSSDPDNVLVGIFDELQQIRGNFRFYATNDVGPRWQMDLTRVLISPTGQFNPISDAYNAMTVTMTHVIDDNGLFGTMKLLPDVSTIVPANVLAPFISGPLKQGDVPAFAKVGEQMRINIGAWIGSQSYAFQWFAAASAVSGADQTTYVPVSGDSGKVLTCHVTATNAVGSTEVTSGPTLAVHA